MTTMRRIDPAGQAADGRTHERMDRVAVLYGEITAATREFLRALAECDRHRDWATEGVASCAEWLQWASGSRAIRRGRPTAHGESRRTGGAG
jgi:hypothetical protein